MGFVYRMAWVFGILVVSTSTLMANGGGTGDGIPPGPDPDFTLVVTTQSTASCVKLCTFLADERQFESECPDRFQLCPDQDLLKSLLCPSGDRCTKNGKDACGSIDDDPLTGKLNACGMSLKISVDGLSEEKARRYCASFRLAGYSVAGCPGDDLWCKEGYWRSEACMVGDGKCNDQYLNC